MTETRVVHILGSRGVPGAHSGFEYLAQHLSLYLHQNGWEVFVYCQLEGEGPTYQDKWQGVTRVNIPVKNDTAWSTILFDWSATRISAKMPGVMLTLGYNTAIFGLLYRLKGIRNVINMDGIEWRRAKWGPLAKLWFYLNDWFGCWLGNDLIADHPEIAKHLARRVRSKKISMIPYGAHKIPKPSSAPLSEYSLEPGEYCIVIARPVPENSILEIVTAFSRLETNKKLVLLGNYSASNSYQAKVLEAAGPQVCFLGAIFDYSIVAPLRYYAYLYIHGHTVGGTNPSLIEALACKSAVLAHDNIYNRWVLPSSAQFFSSTTECETTLRNLFDMNSQVGKMKRDNYQRFIENFQWLEILEAYENVLQKNIEKE